jgi:hypothetical protein
MVDCSGYSLQTKAMELRERAINLQAMFNRMCEAEFRKLTLESGEANNLQNPFNTTPPPPQKKSCSWLFETFTNSKRLFFYTAQATITTHIVTDYDAN